MISSVLQFSFLQLLSNGNADFLIDGLYCIRECVVYLGAKPCISENRRKFTCYMLTRRAVYLCLNKL